MDGAHLNDRHRATYDRIASDYAAANAALPPAVATAARQFVGHLGGSGRVLELGCGHGRDVVWLAERGLSVTGGDLSFGMLHQARAVFQGALAQLDMRRLPFERAVFDGVWSNAAMLHLPKAAVVATLRGVRWVLVEGGWLFVAIQVGYDEGWERVSYGHCAHRFFSRYQPGEFTDILLEAGLTVMAVEESDGGPDRRWAHYLARN